jgi:small subunit ribosomal protein S11
MGKKKIVQQTQEEVLKEQELQDKAFARRTSSVTKKLATGRMYIHSTYNNTAVTLTDATGNVIAWASAGSLGFNGPKKATPFAAAKVVAALAEKVKKLGNVDVNVFVRGVGSGRDSALRSLANHGFNILSIKDVTPIPHNGPRPKKVRRV